MVDSLVTIRIDLLDNSISNNFWQIEVMFHHLDTYVIFIGTGDETHED